MRYGLASSFRHFRSLPKTGWSRPLQRRFRLECLEDRTLLSITQSTIPEPSIPLSVSRSVYEGPDDGGDYGPAAPPLGTSIEGINFDEDAALTGFYQIPPDPIGAAGPSHLVSVVNSSIEWHTKAGTQQNSQKLGTTSGGFFAPLSPVNLTFDPKVVYDQHSGRFVVITLERDDPVGTAGDTSRILVAVSKTSDPNDGWWFAAINSKLTIAGLPRWADYPGLAVDEEALYITNNMFGFDGGSFAGSRVWIIDKGTGSGLYAGGAISFNVYDHFGLTSLGTGTTTQPTQMYGLAPGSTGTFLVSAGWSSGATDFLSVIRVDSPLSSPVFSNQFVSQGDITSGAIPGAPQLGAVKTIDAGDGRAQNAVWRSDALWVAQTVNPPSGFDAGQATAHWTKISTSSLAALSLADQGNVGGNDLATNTHTFYPSIAVDASGNMGIGFAASAATIFPGAYYSGRLATDAAGTTQSTGTLAAGLDTYVRTFTTGSTGRNRWGDYSGIAIDPSNNSTFWLFNEYALTRGTAFGGEDGRWGTKWGSFAFSSPDIKLLGLTTTNGGTTLEVQYEIVAGPMPAFDIGFYRSADGLFGGDTLLDSVSITAGGDLTSGVHTKTYTLSGAAADVSFPGIGLAEDDLEYQILGVADPTNAVAEDDVNPFTEDNTKSFVGKYYAGPGAAIFVHGSDAVDLIDISDASGLTVTVNGVSHAYTVADVGNIRVRAHADNDTLSKTGAVTKPTWVLGGTGNDTLTTGDGVDTLFGGDGDDTLNPGSAPVGLLNYVEDGRGNDIINSVGMHNWAYLGTSSAETITLSVATGTISGLPAAKYVIVRNVGGSDVETDETTLNLAIPAMAQFYVEGQGGDDIIHFSADTVTTTLGNGVQTRNTYVGGDGADTITGGSTAEVFIGGGHNDTLTGGDGDDTYIFFANEVLGTDTLSDSGGVDTLDYSQTTTLAVNLNLATTTLQVVNANSSLILGSSVFENAIGGALADTLTGNTAANRLEGGGGDDTLTGSSGDDTYAFDADSALGSDTVTETTGIDTLDFSATSGQSISISLALSTVQVVNPNISVKLNSTSAFENVTGGGMNDLLTGNTAANRFEGLAGNDTLSGAGGNDLYVFDTDTPLGSDTLAELSGQDKVDFSPTSTLAVTINLSVTGSQAVNANLNLALGSTGIEQATGGALNDTITGSSLGNRLEGGPGNDTINGGSGSDFYVYDLDAPGTGDDTLTDTSGTETIEFSPTSTVSVTFSLGTTAVQAVGGGSTIKLSSATTFDNIIGGGAADTLTGNTGANRIEGGNGNDTLLGGAGKDTYIFKADSPLGTDTLDETGGGAGIDYLDFTGTITTAVTVDLSLDALQTVNANLSIILGTGANFEGLIGGTAGDTLLGNGNANLITGAGGNDTLQGAAGDDTYIFDADIAAGNDVIDDSSGVDLVDFATTTVQTVSLNLGTAGVQTVNGFLTLNLTTAGSIENVTGGSKADNLIGTSGNNKLQGGPGNDTLDGGAGDDIYVFDTDKQLNNDIVLDSSGIDTVDFFLTTGKAHVLSLASAASQVVNSNLTVTLPADAIENVLGGKLADNLTGGAGANRLEGAGGNDTLTGGAGDDVYAFDADGPLGTDTLNEAGGGNDTLDFTATTGKALTVNLSLTGAQTVEAVNLSLILGSATAFEKVIGGSKNDTITGNTLANILLGGLGNDTILGGAGRDLIIGGAGADNLNGEADDDLIISGTTSHDSNAAALWQILNEWIGPNDYPTRTSNLNTGAGGLPILDGGTTVFSDGSSVDTMTGSTERDWFFSKSGTDIITDLAGDELVEAL